MNLKVGDKVVIKKTKSGVVSKGSQGSVLQVNLNSSHPYLVKFPCFEYNLWCMPDQLKCVNSLLELEEETIILNQNN